MRNNELTQEKSNDKISLAFAIHLDKAFRQMPFVDEMVLFDMYKHFGNQGYPRVDIMSLTDILDNLYFKHYENLYWLPNKLIDNEEWCKKLKNFITKEIKGFDIQNGKQLKLNEHLQVVADRQLNIYTRKILIDPKSINNDITDRLFILDD